MKILAVDYGDSQHDTQGGSPGNEYAMCVAAERTPLGDR